jgi:hypothetical protein
VGAKADSQDKIGGVCSACAHWSTDDPIHTWAAPCDLGIIAKPEAWQSCTHFVSRERAAGEQQAQSECRPVPSAVGVWQQAWGIKP